VIIVEPIEVPEPEWEEPLPEPVEDPAEEHAPA